MKYFEFELVTDTKMTRRKMYNLTWHLEDSYANAHTWSLGKNNIDIADGDEDEEINRTTAYLQVADESVTIEDVKKVIEKVRYQYNFFADQSEEMYGLEWTVKECEADEVAVFFNRNMISL